jgi:hypothetical protein
MYTHVVIYSSMCNVCCAFEFIIFIGRSERENVDEDILAMGKGAYKVLFN